MTFKQVIRLISLGIIFVVITSVIIMVLPDEYVRGDKASENGGSTSDFQLDLSDALEKAKSLVKITGSDGNTIKLDIEKAVKDIVDKAQTSSDESVESQNDEVQILELDVEPFGGEAYYASTTGKTGDALKEALNEIIDDHTELTYKEVWDALKDIDEDPLNGENVILIYTGKSIPKSSNGTGKDDWNREHVWAKSHGDFGTTMGAGTDLHHIKPADVTVNSSRNNKNFDESDNKHHEAILCRHDEDSFEPRDAVKGDVARMMFYMAVRYEGGSDEPDLELVEYMNESKSPHHGKLTTLIEWHESDPVSDFERRRNNLIYEKYQGNRNPFIDHPEWVDMIWDKAS